MSTDLLERLRQPAYTGSNRCLPCTALNLGLAAVIGGLLGRRNRWLGLLAMGVAVVLITLRGYLVPGTPTLTKRYLPARLLAWFGNKPTAASGFSGAASTQSTTDDTAEVQLAHTAGQTERASGNEPVSGTEYSPATDLESFLLTREILEPCPDSEDLQLTDAFERAWFDAMAAVEADDLDGAAVVDALDLETAPETATLAAYDDRQVLRIDQGIAGRWPSRAALIADVAACRVLPEWDSDWEEREPATRGQVGNALRLFLERCPTGGPITMSEEAVESCCSSHDVIAVTCEETGERLFEQRVDDLEP